MLPYLLFQCLPFIICALLLSWAARRLVVPRTRTYKCAAEVRKLLNPPEESLGNLLSSRAIPNQRLVHAFGLTNTFVSGDVKIHRTFTAVAKALIALEGDKDHAWHTLALTVEASMHRFLSAGHTIAFATLIQCVTFSVVLTTLFHIDPDTLCYDDVVDATEIINKQWTNSKIKNAEAMRRDKDGSLSRLHAHIYRWIADRDRFPNPLDLILPAFETMWRVVAVTVAHVYRCRDNTLQECVLAFGKNPTEMQFGVFGGEGRQPSMQAIMLEVLRLHPPTRHIVRTSGGVGGSRWWSWRRPMHAVPAIEIADIESVHLSDEYGKDTSVFDPMRFHPLRMQDRPELFSFGYGRLRCVAAAWAPMAAAVIAATIVSQIEEMGGTVTVGPKIGGRKGWEEWTVGI